MPPCGDTRRSHPRSKDISALAEVRQSTADAYLLALFLPCTGRLEFCRSLFDEPRSTVPRLSIREGERVCFSRRRSSMGRWLVDNLIGVCAG